MPQGIANHRYALPSKAMTFTTTGFPNSYSIKQMFWNWYTLDACFVSKTWHITSHTMFAASCFAVVGLVLLLEFLHRLQREYDRHLLHRLQQRGTIDVEKGSTCGVPMPEGNRNARSSCEDPPSSARPLLGDWERSLPLGGQPCGPSAFQQAIRSGMYMLQFVVAYVIMLLAMYYNGYILLCILIGTFIGPFIFSRDALGAASM